MKSSSKRLSRENRDMFAQGRSSSIFWLLENDSEDKLNLPINSNTLQFHDKITNQKFQNALYLDECNSSISKEFKQNLITFFVYLTSTLIFIIASVSSLYEKDRIPSSTLIFNLIFCSIILLFSYLFLVCLLNSKIQVTWSANIITCLGLLFCTYATLSHPRLLPSLLNSDNYSNPIPFSLIICSFFYFYRLVQFDNFKSTIILSTYTSVLFLVLQVSITSSNLQDKLIEYFFLVLFLTLNSIESYKVNSRTALIFYRLYYEDIKNQQFEQTNSLANAEFISGSELLIEKCDNVINEIRHTKKLIMFKDVRDRLKFSIKTLSSIKKNLGRSGINNEFINISDTAKIDEQDKQFIAQNFLSITKFYPEKSYTRNLTLKDLLKKRPRFSLSMQVLQEGSELLDKIGSSWNLSMFELSEKFGGPVAIIGKHFFYKWGISDLLNSDREIFFRFFENLEINYHENPYHNSKHAACVFNSFLCLISNSKIESLMSQLESVVSMIACLAHDIGHPGVTNRYLVSSRNELALRYNDMSVLENMHCALVYKLLSDPNYNIFESLKHSEWSNSRKLMIEMILNTDMSKHFETISRFRMRNSSLKDLNEEIIEDRTAILTICLKCADLGHSAKVFELHEKWTGLVCQEFFLQGDMEKENNMAVSMYCDRDNTDIPKSQSGFIRNICIPLFLVFFSYSQSEFVERECLQQLYNNLNIWDEKSKEKSHSKDHPKDH